MIIKIDLQSDIPLYQQLCNSIIEAIAKDELVSGESLPTVRQLSADLGINMHTVSKAYNILKQKGFISLNRSKGAAVNPKESFSAKANDISDIKSNMIPSIAECLARDMTENEIAELVSICINEIKEDR